MFAAGGVALMIGGFFTMLGAGLGVGEMHPEVYEIGQLSADLGLGAYVIGTVMTTCGMWIRSKRR